MKSQNLRNVLADEANYATTLVTALIDTYGTQLFEWNPESLTKETKTVLNLDLPPTNADKIWAFISTLTTNLFYVSVEGFTHVCNSLSGVQASFQTWDPLLPEEILWGVIEVGLNDPLDDTDIVEWSHEVKHYIGQVFGAHGFTEFPKTLKLIVEKDPDPNVEPFTDDPAIYNAYYDAQKDKVQVLDEIVRQRMREMIVQIQSLPLANGQPDLSSFKLS